MNKSRAENENNEKEEGSNSSDDNSERHAEIDSQSEGDDDDLLDSAFERKQKQRKITEEMWSGIKAESVKHLPEGVDGLRVFKIPSESLKNEGKNIFKDGRTGKRIAQPNGKATVVSGMRTAKDLADVAMHNVLSWWSSVM